LATALSVWPHRTVVQERQRSAEFAAAARQEAVTIMSIAASKARDDVQRYSSFLRHAERAAQDHGLDVRDILIEVGRRGLVGGEEDMIGDVGLDLLSAARGPKNLPFGRRAADPFGDTVCAALKTGS
jgi:hypothetical protein